MADLHERGSVSDAGAAVGARVRRADVVVALEDVSARPARIRSFTSHTRHERQDGGLKGSKEVILIPLHPHRMYGRGEESIPMHMVHMLQLCTT